EVDQRRLDRTPLMHRAWRDDDDVAGADGTRRPALEWTAERRRVEDDVGTFPRWHVNGDRLCASDRSARDQRRLARKDVIDLGNLRVDDAGRTHGGAALPRLEPEIDHVCACV